MQRGKNDCRRLYNADKLAVVDCTVVYKRGYWNGVHFADADAKSMMSATKLAGSFTTVISS